MEPTNGQNSSSRRRRLRVGMAIIGGIAFTMLGLAPGIRFNPARAASPHNVSRPTAPSPTVTTRSTPEGVEVSWHNAPENAGAFDVRRTDPSNTTPVVLNTKPVVGTSYLDHTAVAGVSYTYTVTVVSLLSQDAAQANAAATVDPFVGLPKASVGDNLGSSQTTYKVTDSRATGRAATSDKTTETPPPAHQPRGGVPHLKAKAVRPAMVATAHVPDAACKFSGSITTQTWSSTTCPGGYEVTADLIVPDGQTLTIQPGTTVYVDQSNEQADIASLDPSSNTDIVVQGGLVSNGTSNSPVVITTILASSYDQQQSGNTLGTPAPGDWGDLLVDGTGSHTPSVQLSNTTVRFGDTIVFDHYVPSTLTGDTIQNMWGDYGYNGGTGLLFDNVPPGSTVNISQLAYDGSAGQNGVGMQSWDQTDPYSQLPFTGGSFNVSVSGSQITGDAPLWAYAQNNGGDLVTLGATVTNNTITETGESTAVWMETDQGSLSDSNGSTDGPDSGAGSAVMTGSFTGNTVSGGGGNWEGFDVGAWSGNSDAPGASTCTEGAYAACNDVSFSNNTVSSSGRAAESYATVSDGSGNALVANQVGSANQAGSGGSYSGASDEGWNSWSDNYGTGGASNTSGFHGATIKGSDYGVRVGSYAEGGPASHNVTVDTSNLSASGSEGGEGIYASSEGESDNPDAANGTLSLTNTTVDGPYRGAHQWVESDGGAGTGSVTVNGSTLTSEQGRALYDDVVADDDTGTADALANTSIVSSKLTSAGGEDGGDAVRIAAYSYGGNATSSPSVTGSTISSSGSDAIDNAAYGSNDCEGCTSGDATANPTISGSTLSGYSDGLDNYASSYEGAATANPAVTSGSSLSATNSDAIDNEADSAQADPPTGPATANPTVQNSTLSGDESALWNYAQGGPWESSSSNTAPADASVAIDASHLAGNWDDGVESFAYGENAGASTINPTITNSTISAPDDTGIDLNSYADGSGTSNIGGQVTGTTVNSMGDAFYAGNWGSGADTAATTTQITNDKLQISGDGSSGSSGGSGVAVYGENDGNSLTLTPAISGGSITAPFGHAINVISVAHGPVLAPSLRAAASPRSATTYVAEAGPTVDNNTSNSFYGIHALAIDTTEVLRLGAVPHTSGYNQGSVLVDGHVDNSSVTSTYGDGIAGRAVCVACSDGATESLSAKDTNVSSFLPAGNFVALSLFPNQPATESSSVISDNGSVWQSSNSTALATLAWTLGAASIATDNSTVQGMHLSGYGGGDGFRMVLLTQGLLGESLGLGVDDLLNGAVSIGALGDGQGQSAVNTSTISNNLMDNHFAGDGAGLVDLTVSNPGFVMGSIRGELTGNLAKEPRDGVTDTSTRSGTVSGNSMTGMQGGSVLDSGIVELIGGAVEVPTLAIQGNTVSNVGGAGIAAFGTDGTVSGQDVTSKTAQAVRILDNSVAFTGGPGIATIGVLPDIEGNTQHDAGLAGIERLVLNGHPVGNDGVMAALSTDPGLVKCNAVWNNTQGVEYVANGPGDPVTVSNSFTNPVTLSGENGPWNLVTDTASPLVTDATGNWWGPTSPLVATILPLGTGTVDSSSALAGPPSCTMPVAAVVGGGGGGGGGAGSGELLPCPSVGQGVLPSATNPLTATVGVPGATDCTGVSFTPNNGSGFTAPGAYSLVGIGMQITAPPGSPTNPLQLTFSFPAALLPPGTGPQDVTVFRDGSPVAHTCATSNPVSPDPCEVSATESNGIVTITILSSHASTWNFAASTAPGSIRLAGADREGTAIAISQASYAGGGAGAVVLAKATDYPDALAGAALAVAKNAPILLTSPNSLDGAVAAEISRVLPKGGTVYLLGGTSALSDAVGQQVTALGYTVTRYGAADRYGTAVAIAQALGTAKTVLLANGADFPDALSASAATGTPGTVVLLTNGSQLPAATAGFLAANQIPTFAVGGPAAVADKTATPLVGADRYATAVMVAQQFFKAPTAAGLATGLNFPDALAAGPRLAQHGMPLLLTDPASLPASVSGYLTSVKSSLVKVEVLGGPAAVSTAVQSAATTAIGG